MTPFIKQAQCYAAYQQKATSGYIQMASVPLIMLSIMILLGFVRVVILGVLNIDLAEIATFALLVYSFRLHWRLAFALAPVLIFLLWIAECFSYSGPSSLALEAFMLSLIIGCALQFISYFIEGKRPPLSAVLIAPLYLVAELFFMVGFMHDLKEEIHGKKSMEIPGEASGMS